MKKVLIYIKIICFVLILFLILAPIQFILQKRNRTTDNSSYQIINFYKEKENSLDAVFVGSSSCYAFYSPLFAYNSYGLLSSNYSSSGMGVIAYKYAIEEIRKTQKDALIVISVTPNDEMSYMALHFMSDYMPISFNKIKFLSNYFVFNNESIFNSFGFYFTLWEYHDRWSELSKDDFIIDKGTKGAVEHEYYLNYVTDISKNYIFNNEKDSSDSDYTKLMKDLIEYCSEKEHNILFLFPPRVYDEQKNKQTNYLIDYIVDNGFDVLDLRDKASLIGLDLKRDYYDNEHTNIHGSIKYTNYLADYIKNNYNLESTEDINFDRSFNIYSEIITPYVLENEFDMINKDYNIKAPCNFSCKKNSDNYILYWDDVSTADGYCIYQKEDNMWKKIGETNDNEYSVSPGTYTIVGYRNETDGRKYGNYDYKGYVVELN